MIAKLICPGCRKDIVQKETGWECPACKRQFPRRRGILSFLDAEASATPQTCQQEQEHHWSNTAQLRGRIRQSRALSLLNRFRIQFSFSGRRDRIFCDEMRGGDPNRLILDIGCGGGRHYFSDYGKVIGIDPVLELLQIAKTIYSEVYHASALELPFTDQSFDYVVSSDVIGHIPTEAKDKMFAEMYRVLRPGGRTVHVIETDGNNCWFQFAHRYPELFQKYFIDLPGHISLEPPSQLRNRFLKHGFKQVQFKPLAGTISDCGGIAGAFDNEYKTKSAALRLLVPLDRLLSRQLLTKELVNLLLEPVAQVADRLLPIERASSMLVVFEKPPTATGG